jgi:hypothetical protein
VRGGLSRFIRPLRPASAMLLLVEPVAAALSGRLARLHDLAVAVGVLADLALVGALAACVRRLLLLLSRALLLARLLLRLRFLVDFLVAHVVLVLVVSQNCPGANHCQRF